jgi:hypothetical protein
MTKIDDDALDAALARALGPEAEDTAPLSRAVLSRIAGQEATQSLPLAEALAMPLPATGLMLAALLLAGATGYALVPKDLEELLLLQVLLGAGF